MPLFAGRPVMRVSALVVDSDLDMAGHAIFNLAPPALDNAVVPKSYIDAQDTTHSVDTTNVHGITNCDRVETISVGYAPYIIGDEQIIQEAGGCLTTSTTYVRLKYFKIKYLNPTTTTIRIKYNVHSNTADVDVYTRIYRNGLAYGAEHVTLGPQAVTEDLQFSVGDTVELWGRTTDSYCAVVCEGFRITGTDQRQLVPNGIEVYRYD